MAKKIEKNIPYQGFHITTTLQDRLCGEGKCPAYDVCNTRFGSQDCKGHRGTLSALNTTPDQK